MMEAAWMVLFGGIGILTISGVLVDINNNEFRRKKSRRKL